MSELPTDTVEFAVDLVRQASRLVREGHARGPSQVRTKQSSVDLVTEVDLASEQLITEALRARFPDHIVYAEESGGDLPEGCPVWVADPLDGTTNFAHGFPVFGVSLALICDGRVELGVTCDPLRDEIYWARRGEGAYCNGRRLRVSETAGLGESLLATGFQYDRATNADNNLAEFSYFMPKTRGVRRAGAASLDLAWIAAGRLDGYWEKGLHVWDFAAGQVLIEEAGGRVTTYAGHPWHPRSGNMVASNGVESLHEALLHGIASARGGLPGLY